MSNLEGLIEGKCKLLVNVAMSVIYRDLIWADAVNVKAYLSTKMVSVQWKPVLRCISAYRTVFTEEVCVLAGIPQSG